MKKPRKSQPKPQIRPATSVPASPRAVPQTPAPSAAPPSPNQAPEPAFRPNVPKR